MDLLADIRDSTRLRYWLGPWAPRGDRPDGAIVRELAGLPRGSRLYAPADRAARGGFLLSPGLHYDGPNDPRMDRLARILVAAGHVVLSPAVPDLMAMRLTPAVAGDVARALEALLDAPELPAACRPAVFGISVGSLGALRVAAQPRFAAAISQVVLFGGYGDHVALIRSLTCAPRDPLNAPAAFVTMLDGIASLAVDDAERLREAWRCMIRATWPRADFKVPGGTAHHPIAHAIAHEIPAHLRRLFLVGCGVEPGGWELCVTALHAPGAPYAYMDPRPDLARLGCPITIVHGVADDVIPFAQAAVIERALPSTTPCTTLPTGLFAHSSNVSLSNIAGHAVVIARELRTLHRICRAVERA